MVVRVKYIPDSGQVYGLFEVHGHLLTCSLMVVRAKLNDRLYLYLFLTSMITTYTYWYFIKLRNSNIIGNVHRRTLQHRPEE